MKPCPKCQANISDTAKFCMECGCNIKQYEEEQAQPKARFCPECGTEITKGVFCPECGYHLDKNLNSEATCPTTDAFGDDWLSDLESISNADVAAMKAQESKEQMEKAFAAFEYEAHTDGTYTITGLKDKTAIQYVVPDGVVAISAHAFEGCNAIRITLSEDILQIGNCAFKGCCNLSNINLPASLMFVGDEAFAECEMLDVKLPATVRRVGKNAILNTVQDKKRQAEEAVQKTEEARKAEEARKTEEARKAEEARIAELAKCKVGDNPTFGSYYKGSNGSYYSSFKSPIEWIVLEKDGNKLLIISKYGIDCKQYNTDCSDTAWETSNLRKWLNGEFIKNTFSAAEQQKIQITKVSTPNSSRFVNNGDNITNDKVFALSIDEANRYFGTDEQRKCSPTAYAVSNGAVKYDNGCCPWWLRSPGSDRSCAASISGVGAVYVGGTPINYEGCCVRPAMWVKIP